MKITFIGAAHEVTGSMTLLEVGDKKGLIDCGMEQGKDLFKNAELPVTAGEIDFVLLTHAHIDHSGNLPLLYKQGFRGNVFATEATCNLCDIMLQDCAHIQMQEAEWKTRKEMRKGNAAVEPIYDMEDVQGLLGTMIPCRYHEMIEVNDCVSIRFTDVGHLLGSACIEVWLTEDGQERKITFSGDLGNSNQPILRDPQTVEETEYLMMETTYGDRNHERVHTDYVSELAEIIQTTMDRGGNVVIPSFAIGRTQEMLYFIREIKNRGLVRGHDSFPVYVDSPLAVEATQIFYECGYECYDEEAKALLDKGRNPIDFPNLRLSVTTDESKAINDIKEPKVIISASGMCDAGRIKHHLKYNLWRPDSTVLIVGYQSIGSPGRKLVDGAGEIKLFGEDVAVRARIAVLPGLSGHADRLGLLEWIGGFKTKPRQVFVVHGEDQVAEQFAKTLNEDCAIRAFAPFSGTRYDLASGKFIEITKGIPITKVAPGRTVSNSFTKLKLTARKVLDFVNGCSGLPNKDLERFSMELEALCEKYKR